MQVHIWKFCFTSTVVNGEEKLQRMNILPVESIRNQLVIVVTTLPTVKKKITR